METCLHGPETSFRLPQDVVDIPGTWYLLRFVGIFVLFKVMEAEFLSLTHIRPSSIAPAFTCDSEGVRVVVRECQR